MEFYDGWNKKMKDPGEAMDETSPVEIGGYIPADKQIAAMIQAGERLNAHRMEEYYEEQIEPEINPMSRPGADLTDQARAIQAFNERLEEVDSARRKAAEEAAAEARQAEIDAAVQAELAKRAASAQA